MVHLTRQRRKEILTLVVVFLGVLLVSAFVVYFLSGTRTQPGPRATATPATQPTPGDQSPAPVATPAEDGFFSEVGDSAARAFGIFAAASLVRFRTNIRDPKEITVLLLCLAVGLASGVGRWDLGLVLCLFSLLLLLVLEYREPEQVFRSMDLSIGTRNVAATHDVLRDVFDSRGFDSELRGIKRNGAEDSPGNIMYSIDLGPTVTTDEVSEEILRKDPTNVESIEWEQKKSFSYLYQ